MARNDIQCLIQTARLSVSPMRPDGAGFIFVDYLVSIGGEGMDIDEVDCL